MRPAVTINPGYTWQRAEERGRLWLEVRGRATWKTECQTWTMVGEWLMDRVLWKKVELFAAMAGRCLYRWQYQAVGWFVCTLVSWSTACSKQKYAPNHRMKYYDGLEKVNSIDTGDPPTFSLENKQPCLPQDELKLPVQWWSYLSM